MPRRIGTAVRAVNRPSVRTITDRQGPGVGFGGVRVPAAAIPPRPVAPRPVTPVAPTPGAKVRPPDAQFSSDVGVAQLNQANNLANVAAARQQGLIGYGYTETNGTVAFNPNDPFSKAALLKRAYDSSRARTGTSMAAGGQLYSGAYQQAQDIGNRDQLQGEDAMQRSLLGFLAGNTGQRTAAGTTYEQAMMRAESGRMGRVDTNPLYSPEAVPKPPAKPGAGKGGRGKKGGIGTAVHATSGVTTRVGPRLGPGVTFGKTTNRTGPRLGPGVKIGRPKKGRVKTVTRT